MNRQSGNVTVEAEVMRVSQHAYWIFEDGHSPDSGRLASAAAAFETTVWPAVTSALGDVWNPGVDGDPRIVIFHGVLRPGVAGYFSGNDEYPVEIQPESNQREAIVISADVLTFGGQGYMSTLAHELQHAIHWAADVGEESWLNEGLSEVATGLAGLPAGSVNAFLRQPNTSLVQWEPEIFQASPNYGASALFFEYISAHYGGVETLRAIVNEQTDGLDSVTLTLQNLGYDETAVSIFTDWVVANFADDETGLYSHPDRTTRTPRLEEVEAPHLIEDSVRPFGTRYYRIEDTESEVMIEFSGSPEGRIFEAEPHSGHTCWWSNAGDSINTTLTRSVDLSIVDSATFEFWAWYAIEEDWDYAYFSISQDGGETWNIVPTENSTFANPNGTAFGPGLTGITDGWVKDSVDLSPYTGSEVLIRLEYITDDAIHDRGACFDDFSIPEIGWSDSTETTGGWVSEGFALINDRLPVEYLVQVIHDTDSTPAEVTRVTVDQNGNATVTVRGPNSDEQLVLAVSVVTPHVTGSLDYTVDISTR